MRHIDPAPISVNGIAATTASAVGVSWRTVLPVHPAVASIFRPMSEAELAELAADIKANGIELPVALWSPGNGQPHVLLDGRNRLDAAELAGIQTVDFGRLVMPLKVLGPSVDPVAYVVSANLHRRHLTAEDKRDVIAALLKASPEKSDRQISKLVNVDHKTVGSVRAEKAATGELPPVERRVGADGKTRKPPMRKTKAKPADKAASESVISSANAAPDYTAVTLPTEASTKVPSSETAHELTQLEKLQNENVDLRRVNLALEDEVSHLKSEIARLKLEHGVDKIVERCRKIRAFLNHPEQHVDAIRKLVTEILHAADPEAKAARPVSILSDKLDVAAFGRAMCLPAAGSDDAATIATSAAAEMPDIPEFLRR